MISKQKMCEFLDKLGGEDGCQFKGTNFKDWKWQCDGTPERPKAHAILRSMGIDELDIAEIMNIAIENGGYCDCEILFNAEDALMEIAK